MKKFIIQFLVLVVVIFGALAYTSKGIPNFSFGTHSVAEHKTLQIGNVKINAEIADDANERKKGLSNRDILPEDAGMLFVFQTPDRVIFWMKGLKFPLDLIWIRENRVVDIIRNATVPESDQSDDQLPRYMPNQPVDMALEVNAGFVDKYNIKVGDSLEILE